LTPPIRPRVSGDLAVVELDGEAVVYHERDGSLHHLNPSATIVFGLCDGESTISAIAADLADAYAVPQEQMEPQVRSVVRQFRREGLLDG
jgi:PqqD family protein of HPr-rel-A system